MHIPRRPFVFAVALAIGLLSPRGSPAAVVPALPENIVISKMNQHGDLIFILYANEDIEKGFFLDPKTAGQSGNVRLPTGLPEGKLSLLGVPRTLAEKSKKSPDPAWLRAPPPGIVRVTGVIHHYPVERSSAVHQYELEKADDGLKLTLLNPEVLTPYPPEEVRPAKKSETAYLWLGFAGVVTVLIAGVVIVWILRRRGSEGGPSM
jgi:hypothetical protein